MTSTFPNIVWPLNGPLGPYSTAILIAVVINTSITISPLPPIQSNHHHHHPHNTTNTTTTTIPTIEKKPKCSTNTTIRFTSLTTAFTTILNNFKRLVCGVLVVSRLLVLLLDTMVGMLVVAVVGYCTVLIMVVVVTVFVRVAI